MHTISKHVANLAETWQPLGRRKIVLQILERDFYTSELKSFGESSSRCDHSPSWNNVTLEKPYVQSRGGSRKMFFAVQILVEILLVRTGGKHAKHIHF